MCECDSTTVGEASIPRQGGWREPFDRNQQERLPVLERQLRKRGLEPHAELVSGGFLER